MSRCWQAECAVLVASGHPFNLVGKDEGIPAWGRVKHASRSAGHQSTRLMRAVDRLSQQNAELQRAASGLEAALTQAEERLTQERRHVDKLLRGHHALEVRGASGTCAHDTYGWRPGSPAADHWVMQREGEGTAW